MPRLALFALLFATPLLGGCLAKAAIGVATAPVRVASQAADWATTSQDEADRARGREIRGREERIGQLQRRYDNQAEECREGNNAACRAAVETQREIDGQLAGIPVEPHRN